MTVVTHKDPPPTRDIPLAIEQAEGPRKNGADTTRSDGDEVKSS